MALLTRCQSRCTSSRACMRAIQRPHAGISLRQLTTASATPPEPSKAPSPQSPNPSPATPPTGCPPPNPTILLSRLAQRLEGSVRGGSSSSSTRSCSSGTSTSSSSGYGSSPVISPLSSLDPEEAAALAAQAAREAFITGDLGFGFSAGAQLGSLMGAAGNCSRLGS